VTRLLSGGFPVSPSQANFVLVEVGDGAAFRSRLMERGFVVRDCASFGLAGHVRVAIPHDDQFERLMEAMEASR
jgi:histidinol-phosphate/aromatic aminotransferase/cobyric acid decarboxylase-like protein